MVSQIPPVRPMKATAGTLPDSAEGWVFELKWDGMRVLAHLGEGTELYSARALPVSVRFPELADLHVAVGVPAHLDGEVVALDERGLPSFSRLQHRMHVDRAAEARRRAAEVPVGYQVFDVLSLDGHDVTGLPLGDRRRLLESLVEPGPAWRLTEQYDDGVELLELAEELELEGVVAKRLDSPYRVGRRSSQWRKVKVRRHQEFVVGGFTTGTGKRSGGLGALVLGYRADGALRCAGRVGSGFDDAELQRLGGRLRERVTDDDPFQPPLARTDAAGVTFVRPELVVEVAFAEWSPDDRLRHPVYLGERTDVDPAEVTRAP